jgi:membrane-bound ClpP family serine protease
MNFEAIFQSGNIAWLIIVVMLVEAILLLRYFKNAPAMAASLAAGACLVLALRAALIQQNWTYVAMFLTLGFVFHILEIWQWMQIARRQPQ